MALGVSMVVFLLLGVLVLPASHRVVLPALPQLIFRLRLPLVVLPKLLLALV
jgi:hypothetical protein